MIAIANALNFAESNYVGRLILLFSHSLSSLSQISSSHWKYSLSDTKLRLLHAFRRVCQVSTITLVHVPGHSAIWQNELVDKLAKQVLLSSNSFELKSDISDSNWFARTF